MPYLIERDEHLRHPTDQGAPSQLPGRLLLYVPWENVSDGASQYASNRFFDLYDCPPWDTWILYSHGTSAPRSAKR